MSKVRIISLIVCVIALLGMAPHILYSDYKRSTTSEKILFKKETVDSRGEPKYYFILNRSGSTSVTPQSFYSYEKGQDFRYFSTKDKAEKITDFYGLSFFLLFLVFWLFVSINYLLLMIFSTKEFVCQLFQT